MPTQIIIIFLFYNNFKKVNEGREKVGHNPRRIGENPNPAGLKFTTKNTFD